MEASPKRRLGAVEFALAHVRSSSGVLADAESLSRSLASGIVEPASGMAVEMHLREADPAELADLVVDGAATFHSLAALSDRLVGMMVQTEFLREAAA